MKASRKLLYFVSIVGLVGTAALAVDRIGTPSMSPLLTWSVVIGVAAGAPGLIHRRAWPLALILVPLGAYLILRAQLPLPDSVHGLGDHIAFYRSQLRIGAGMYTTRHLPFDLRGAPELRILLSLVVYLVAATASFVALSMRKALPAIAIALALLGFGLTIDQADRVLWLPFVFLAMVGCVLALSHSLQRQRWKAGDALAGVGAGIVAAVLAFSLLGTTSVASSRPWQDWRTWGASSPHGDTRLSFDWMVNYPTLLDEQSDGQVMKVKSAVASYWRANALDYFDGRVWYGKASNAGQFTGVETAGSYLYRVPFQYPEVPGELVKQDFDITSLYTGYLLAGGTARELTLNSAMNVSTNPAQALKLDHAVGPGFRYQVTAVVPQVLPADLVDLGQDYPVRVLPYRELPFPTLKELGGSDPEAAWIAAMSESLQRREWLDLYRLNEDVVRDATDPYQIALLIEERLRRGYDYSLRPPLSHLESPYAAFLFDTRSGFCQQFAGAMAVMLRFNGIPARVAVGFATGDRGKDGWFVVKRTDAHAWVEAFFPGVGWVPFDPTPGRSLPVGATSSSSAGFIDPVRGRRECDHSRRGGLPAGQPARLPARRDRRRRQRRDGAGPRDARLAAVGRRARGGAAGVASRASGRAAAQAPGRRRRRTTARLPPPGLRRAPRPRLRRPGVADPRGDGARVARPSWAGRGPARRPRPGRALRRPGRDRGRRGGGRGVPPQPAAPPARAERLAALRAGAVRHQAGGGGALATVSRRRPREAQT